MAQPEFEPQHPAQPDVQQVPTTPEVPAAVEQGATTQQPVQAVPADPQQLQHPSGSVMAQPVPAPQDDTNLPTFEVPEYQSEEQIEQYTHGEAEDSVTWNAVSLLRVIHSKIKHGFRVIFGQANN